MTRTRSCEHPVGAVCTTPAAAALAARNGPPLALGPAQAPGAARAARHSRQAHWCKRWSWAAAPAWVPTPAPNANPAIHWATACPQGPHKRAMRACMHACTLQQLSAGGRVSCPHLVVDIGICAEVVCIVRALGCLRAGGGVHIGGSGTCARHAVTPHHTLRQWWAHILDK
jgi:hypothetical protein